LRGIGQSLVEPAEAHQQMGTRVVGENQLRRRGDGSVVVGKRGFISPVELLRVAAL
jgi:hypothetical protein